MARDKLNAVGQASSLRPIINRPLLDQPVPQIVRTEYGVGLDRLNGRLKECHATN
ncbi:MAG TPA: hypothetical protein VKG25_12310 [Bryobacteraceae bacterium]|nr:hypothetical protein [Bryobacteraceae bacterium]